MFRETLTFEDHHCGHGCATMPAGDTARREPVAGYGACSVSGCICQGYTGSGPLCENCAHNYADHW